MHRRWWLVIAGSAAHAINTGFSYFGISAYFPSFEQEFGWSRAAISGAFSLARIESGIIGPLEGYLTDRLGPFRMMRIGIALGVMGFIALNFVYSLPMLYAVMLLGIVLGSSLGYNLPISVAVANVFRARRSLAFGIFRGGPGLSGVLLPLVGWMIVSWGWRKTALATAGLLLLTTIPLAWFMERLYREREVEGSDFVEAEPREKKGEGGGSNPQFTLREAMHTSSFWILSLAMGLRQLVTEGVSVHFVILLVDRGWSTEAASTLLGASAVIGAPARLGAGWMGDLLDKRKLMIKLLISLAVSVLFMGWSTSSWVFTISMVVYSLAYGGLAALQEPIRADYFGTRHFATIQGTSRMFTVVGSFLGPIIAGLFYDLTKTYTVPFTIFAGAGLLSMVCMYLVRPPAVQTRTSNPG